MDGFEKWLTKEIEKTKLEDEFRQHVEATYIRMKYRLFKRGEKL